MKQTKKETWDKIIKRIKESENINLMMPTLSWLKSKGCEEIFYILIGHSHLVLMENWDGSCISSGSEIIFDFEPIVMNKIMLNRINDIMKERKDRNELTKEDEAYLLEIKPQYQQKYDKAVNQLLIEVKTETEYYSHITKINEYDEFELILDKIITDLS